MSDDVSKNISLEITVGTSVAESKKIISNNVLSNPRNTSLFSKAEWDNDTLIVESVFGKGTLQVTEGKLLIKITLSLLGLAVKSTMISELNTRIKNAFQGK